MSNKQLHYRLLAEKVIKAFERRNFEAFYCETADEALKKALELIPAGSSVAWGGSMTIRDMGLTKAIHEGDFKAIDRDLGKSPEEIFELHRQGLLSDFYLTSANAITEDGQLLNIDKTGNRVASICFGPKNVIVIASMNKVVRDENAAMGRIKTTAAPTNSMRFNIKTPCRITGSCADCISVESMCANVVRTRLSSPPKRIKVILVGEDLGY